MITSCIHFDAAFCYWEFPLRITSFWSLSFI